jgi:hypothetical protein
VQDSSVRQWYYLSNSIVNFSVSNLAYDANGNIKSMKQNGLKLNTSPVIDDFSYAYKNTEEATGLLP